VKNPFEYGRELSATEIADRGEEIREVVHTIRECGRLFLIGPRRYGKTSILRAAAEQARKNKAIVFRYNAEAYPTLTTLAERIVADAAKQLAGPIRKAAKKVQETFGSLRPQITYDPINDNFSVALTTGSESRTDQALITETLGGLDQMAGAWTGSVAVIIDEFQKLVEEGGTKAEGQIRAAIQTHDNIGYVFAGSKTRMLSEMTGDENRPFYRLGARLFVGPVPRKDFRPFLTGGFERGGLRIEPDAVEEILDLAEDVPYNVQRLAHDCWEKARTEDEIVTPELVRDVLERLVSRDDPFYTQTWNGLSVTQKKALLAITEHGGSGLFAGKVIRAYDLSAASTMRTALEGLVTKGVAREEEQGGSVRYRLEDPFFAAWLRLFISFGQTHP